MRNDIEPLQRHHDPFSAVIDRRTAPKQEYEYITPMHLLDMLCKTGRGHHDLTRSEKAALRTLITYVNGERVEADAVYEAWPTIELIMVRCEYGRSKVEEARRTLEEKGWVKVQSGTGEGEANHYFINGHKIEAASC